jgi:formylglycine-generating enzyme required for sulfatase activity/predicted Ser/Thr protein kinase
MSEIDPLIGTSLGGCDILELLGKGGMATVYKAHQRSINRTVAVKVLPRILAHDATFMQRFRQEAEVVARLEHVHILPVYDYGEHESMPYIVMRYLEGGTVQDRLKQTPLPWDDVLHITSQVADALDYAHSKGVFHRDIKPSNILLDDEGNAYVADFGIAKMSEGTSHLTGSGIIGTPAYMAPEQSEGARPAPTADVYSLGATLFEMITGVVPYAADTPIAQILMHINNPIPSARECNPEIPAAVDDVIRYAMAKDPRERYQSAGELVRALRPAVAETGGWDWSEEALAALSQRTTVVSATPPSAPATPPGVPAAPRSTRVVRRRSPAGLWIVGILATFVFLSSALALLWFLVLKPGVEQIGRPEPTVPGSGFVVAEVTDTPLPTATPPPVETATPEIAPGGADVGPADTPAPTVEPTLMPEPVELEPTTFKRGVEMVLVPAGPFVMGRNGGYANERPEHEVYLDAFYIDVTEVTNRDYQACVESVDEDHCPARGQNDIGSPSRFRYYGVEAYNDYPVILVSWDEAQTYCRWRGGHLPTEAQWEKAARWDPETGEHYLFPWGTSVLDPYFLNYNSNFGDTTRVKDSPAGVSSVGAYDMAGNVVEWVYDWYLDNYYEQSPPENPPGPATGQFRVIRGGSYESPGAQLFTTFRDLLKPATKIQTLGFRCAWTPSGDPTE